MDHMLEVKNVDKYFHGIQVLKDVSFTMKKGEFFALLGPNGAGKSTMISILCTRILKDRGSVYMNGLHIEKDAVAIREQIGIVFQGSCMDEILHGYDNLSLRCGLYGMKKKEIVKRVQELSKLCGLQEFLYQKVSTLSGGQKRRLDIARALLHSPSLLILDEPTTGLDPLSRQQIWTTIMKLHQEQGMSILLTTHYMEEAKNADSICMMDHGRIKACGTMKEVTQYFVQDYLYLYAQQIEPIARKLEQRKYCFERQSKRLKVPISKTSQALTILRSCAMSYDRFELIAGTLEDTYLSIIQGEDV